jgi:hypothetical protein
MSGEMGENPSYDEDADYLAKLGLKQVCRLASEITVECGAEKHLGTGTDIFSVFAYRSCFCHSELSMHVHP